jgi:two-component system, NarL family, nitrate/nitrite response regulator NarL
LTDKIRVAAVDDHQIFLAGLERAVRRAPDIELVAQGSCGADALRIARDVQPDIMLLDISMPGSGIETARQITRDHSGVKIIILTASNDDEQLSLALSAGADGFLLKGIQLAELLEAIRAVSRGETYMAPEVAGRMLAQKVKLDRKMQAAKQALGNLNAREQEILLNMAKGSTNQEIAERMDLTTSTVRTYVSQIFDKMRVRNRVQAVGLVLGYRQDRPD